MGNSSVLNCVDNTRCMGMRGYAWVCVGNTRCVGMRGCAWVCVGMRGYNIFGFSDLRKTGNLLNGRYETMNPAALSQFVHVDFTYA